MENKPRLRAPNFTTSDNLLLCDIISKYKHIIENKKTDGANLQQKQKAWLDVVEIFNSSTSGCSRTLESLQQNYKNLKKKAKKNASDAKMDISVNREDLVLTIEQYGTSSEGWQKVAESTGASEERCQEIFSLLNKEADIKDKIMKKNIMGTGGGPPPNCNKDPLLEKVKSLVGPVIDGMYTIYDGDSTLMASQNIQPIEAKNLEIESQTPDRPIDIADTDTSVAIQDKENQDNEEVYFKNDRANLKRKPHHLLSCKKSNSKVQEKQTVTEKFTSLASEKLELVMLQKELLKTQLQDEKEKLEHNRLLRKMEMENTIKKYEHCELIRKLELEQYNFNK